MLLYWSENVIVGFYNVLRLLTCQPEEKGFWIAKFFMIPFFIVHYGVFTGVHGIFVVTLFNQGLLESAGGSDPEILWQTIRQSNLYVVMAALFLSHGYSFVTNYLGKGEYRRVTLNKLMIQPYGRIVLLHVTIIIGGFLMMALRSPVIGLLFFILLKIIMDLVAHLKEHKKAGAARG